VLAVTTGVVFLLSGCWMTPAPVPGGPTSAPTTADPGAPTAAPTADPGATSAPSVEPTGGPGTDTEGMVFSDSDTRLLMWNELTPLTEAELGYAKNEIYARAGYAFKTAKYADYFGKFGWYKVDPAFDAGKFTAIQLANIKLIDVAIRTLAGKLTYIPSGTVLDFDQDGVLETLTYKAPSDYNMKLTLKEPGKATAYWNVACDTPSKKVYLGDLSSKDSVLEMFVDEFGPSDDYQIHVAAVKPTAFSSRGLVPGSVGDFKLLGVGKISTLQRMNILMTWFTTVQYKLNAAGKLAFVPQSFYDMGNFKCKTKVALPLLKTSNIDLQETAFLIPVGKTIYLQKTDDKKWISIKYGTKVGWLLMADLYTIMDPYAPATDIIDGLFMAD